MYRLVCCSLLLGACSALLPASPMSRIPRLSLLRRPGKVLLLSAASESDPKFDVKKWEKDVQAKGAAVKAAARTRVLAGAAFYSLIALGFTALLLRTLKSFPLIPPSPSSLLWCRSWLWTTVADYYGAALALSGIIISTDPNWRGFAWAAGCLLLGTPICCMYVASRLLRHGTLRLAYKTGGP